MSFEGVEEWEGNSFDVVTCLSAIQINNGSGQSDCLANLQNLKLRDGPHLIRASGGVIRILWTRYIISISFATNSFFSRARPMVITLEHPCAMTYLLMLGMGACAQQLAFADPSSWGPSAAVELCCGGKLAGDLVI